MKSPLLKMNVYAVSICEDGEGSEDRILSYAIPAMGMPSLLENS